MPGLAIHELTLAQFRSHRRAVFAFDGRPVAIWGANGAGKTNILEAVSLLSPGRGLRRAGAEELARRPDAVGWRVSAGLRRDGVFREIETGAEAAASRSVKIDGKAAPQAALAAVVPMVWLVPAMDRLWIEAAEGRRRFLDRLTLSFAPDHAEASLAYEKAMRQRNRLLKDGSRNRGWYEALEVRMAEEGARIQANRAAAVARIVAAQAGAETAFPAGTLALAGPEGDPQGAAALTAAWAEGRARDLAAGRTLVGPHRADLEAIYAAKGVPAGQCSTGEQKALLLSLVLANARALAAEGGVAPVLLMDEVAAHLDAGRRRALYDEIVALGAQAFLTGTGPELFEGLGDRAQGLEVSESAGISGVRAGEVP
ncbi:DNA replication/repair protein RecF [Frigidibacter sp. MR17.24]|uniref:DNA replication/repair protein RecF n=1 Tax=Frigidibacter sp. MR17.24 TaxID=3127345 RepID=UPI003012B097